MARSALRLQISQVWIPVTIGATALVTVSGPDRYPWSWWFNVVLALAALGLHVAAQHVGVRWRAAAAALIPLPPPPPDPAASRRL